ncbi:hypothetical protein BGLA2_650064 [Burkholderia gladioli]|nr:hypothetical protein BGLA2_650064 [Burkholderia gladioli]
MGRVRPGHARLPVEPAAAAHVQRDHGDPAGGFALSAVRPAAGRLTPNPACRRAAFPVVGRRVQA